MLCEETVSDKREQSQGGTVAGGLSADCIWLCKVFTTQTKSDNNKGTLGLETIQATLFATNMGWQFQDKSIFQHFNMI